MIGIMVSIICARLNAKHELAQICVRIVLNILSNVPVAYFQYSVHVLAFQNTVHMIDSLFIYDLDSKNDNLDL